MYRLSLMTDRQKKVLRKLAEKDTMTLREVKKLPFPEYANYLQAYAAVNRLKGLNVVDVLSVGNLRPDSVIKITPAGKLIAKRSTQDLIDQMEHA